MEIIWKSMNLILQLCESQGGIKPETAGTVHNIMDKITYYNNYISRNMF